MTSTNNLPSRRPQVPDIRIDSPSMSDQTRSEADSIPYSMYPSFMSSSLFSHDGYESSNPQFLPLDELSNEGFSLGELEMSLFSETNQHQQDQDFLEFLTGPLEQPSSIGGFSIVPPSPPPAVPRNTAVSSPYSPVFPPSPSSSYGSLSPSPIGHESPLSPWSITSPSSEGSLSPMVPPLGLSRRDSSASLRHHHSSSDPSFFGHTLQPPAAARHIRSHSESSMTRPVASQAMLEANQRRRRHEASHKCDECGQTFTAIFSLRRHAQSHTGVRPFVCSIPGCRQAFFNQSDCRRHEKSTKRHKGLSHTVSVSP